MRALTGLELAAALERHDWRLLRVSGSHPIYGKPGSRVRLSIPVHGSTPLKRGLLVYLLKMAGLDESDV